MKREDLIEQITLEFDRAADKWGGATSDDRIDRLPPGAEAKVLANGARDHREIVFQSRNV